MFDLNVAQEYAVAGLAIFNFGLTVLVVDETKWPNWYPADLFVVVGGAIPRHWKVAFREGGEQDLQALWGYDALVNDEEHYVGLIERDPTAMEIFWKSAFPS